jgi:hypothetical protein
MYLNIYKIYLLPETVPMDWETLKVSDPKHPMHVQIIYQQLYK